MASPIVLISPAMGVGSRYYRALVDAFHAHGWKAEALPRRGFERGLPRASRSNDWSYADEIRDPTDAVARAREQHPGHPVILLGHSLGAHMAVGHQLSADPADGFVAVAASIPFFRLYSLRSAGVWALGVAIRAASGIAGYVPKPLFGAPGARTLMREWTRMLFKGTPPFPVPEPISTPTLAVRLEGDHLAIPRATDHFERAFVDQSALSRWTYELAHVPEGGNTHHVGWARTPEPVVERIVTWWSEAARAAP